MFEEHYRIFLAKPLYFYGKRWDKFQSLLEFTTLIFSFILNQNNNLKCISFIFYVFCFNSARKSYTTNRKEILLAPFLRAFWN